MEEEAAAQLPTREHVFRSGLIFGAILGAAYVLSVIAQWLIGMYANADLTGVGATSGNIATDLIIRGAVSLLLGIILFLAMLALTFVAGIRAASKTGKVGAGSLAGLLAGVLGGLTGSVATYIAIVTLMTQYAQSSNDSGAAQSQTSGLLIGTAIGVLVEFLLVDGAFGAGAGVLGGLIGASVYRQANSPAPQPLPYPYAPWPYPAPPYAPLPYAGPQHAGPQHAGPQHPAPSYPSQAGYPTAPTLPQELL